MKTVRPPVKMHGGKFYLAQWIVSNFPSDYQTHTYIEPFCGGASVLFNKEPSITEAISDVDVTILQMFRGLRDEPKEFIRRLKRVRYTEETFARVLSRSKEPFDDYLDHAVNEYCLRRMSRGGLKKAFAWSDRLRGGQPGDLNAWKTALELLPSLAARLREVYIFNTKAQDVIKTFNHSNTLVYADPPYLHETRQAKNAYSYEMTTEQHIELARILNNFRGKVILSGYSHPLYNKLYKGWNVEKKQIANHASQKKAKEVKTEVLWKNY